MKNKAVLSIILLLGLSLKPAFGQNLVLNPSFEDTLACPWGQGDINYADGWSSYAISPDYMHTCSSNWISSVPTNWGGYQLPATGEAYVGLTAFCTNLYCSNAREFIGRPLDSTLTIGTTYYVSLKVSLGYKPIMGANCACNNLGAAFTTISYAGDTMPVNNNPKVYSSSIISDTSSWTTITGSFVADSAYGYIVIGNVMSDMNTDTLIIDGDTLCQRAYYFVDDICVTSDSVYFYSFTGASELSSSKAPEAYPNPFQDRLTVKNVSGLEHFELSDAVGQVIYSGKDIGNNDFSSLPQGIYLLRIFGKNSAQAIRLLKY